MDTPTGEKRSDIIPRVAGITPEKRAEIEDALKVQPNATRVAAQFGVSDGSVRQIAKKAGIKLEKQSKGTGKEKPLPAETREGIIKALRANPSAATRIAAQLEVSEATVRKTAKEEGIPLRRGRSPSRAAVIKPPVLDR
jgi:hypothetical protein